MQKPVTYTTSKHLGELKFPTPETDGVEYFDHDFGHYKLEARILFNERRDWPRVLSVHGARSDFTKADAVTLGLRERGISVLGMNLSGHSAAGVLKPEETCLGNNIQEVEAFYQYLDAKKPKVIIAYSLGAIPVLKLLEKYNHEINKLVLFYPAIYAKEAYDKPYGESFHMAINKPFSYRNNDTIELLRQFKGNSLLIKGQYDGLDPVDYGKLAGTIVGEVIVDGETQYSPVPKEVFAMIHGAVPTERRQDIEVLGCDHGVTRWMKDNQNQANTLVAQIADFIVN